MRIRVHRLTEREFESTSDRSRRKNPPLADFSTRPARRWHALAVALLAAVAGLFIASHHPLSAPLAVLGFGAMAVLAFIAPSMALAVVFAALPLIDLAPWSGWITFEEFDLVVLAAVAGGYARFGLLRPAADGGGPRPPAGPGALPALAVLLFTMSVLWSSWRGLEDAGGFAFGWYQGLHEPMNSVRLAKPCLFALLLLPLWTMAEAADPRTTTARLSAGLALGLAGAALATVWEREAFTGLLDFSSDYRTTALFWEMNVGGAALDGFLALTVPFAVRELTAARSPARWCLAAGIVLVAVYACVTTFSRGVYLAIPVGLSVLLALQAMQQRRMPGDAGGSGAASAVWLPAVGLLGAYALAAAWLFPTSGYRGLLALLGAVAVWLPLADIGRRPSRVDALLGLSAGLLLSAAVYPLVALLLPRATYALYGLGVIAGAALVWRHPAAVDVSPGRTRLALAGFVWVLAGMVAVAHHWGGDAASWRAWPVAVAMLAPLWWSASRRAAPWPASRRWQGTLLAAMAGLSTVVGALGGGLYMTGRFSTGQSDFAERVQHWREGLAMLESPADKLFGKGLGRYPSSLFFSGLASDQTGDYRLQGDGETAHLRLTGGKFEAGWGEIFRVSQRVQLPALPVTVTADVRTERKTGVHFEVCEKHLLYNAGCVAGAIDVPPEPGRWQRVQLQLGGDNLSRGAWFAPRLIMFSVGIASKGGSADLDNIRLVDASGRDLLSNGGFAYGMAHWFFSSDRYHLAWHIKSLYANLLFDQGALGLALASLLAAGALWRLTFGAGREHPLAPAIAAALTGFGVVGLFDSLLDVPRVATVFYFLLFVALGLPAAPRRRRMPGSEPPVQPTRSSAEAPRAATDSP